MNRATLKNRSHIFAEYRIFVWLILKPTLASSPWIFYWYQLPASESLGSNPIIGKSYLFSNLSANCYRTKWSLISMKIHSMKIHSMKQYFDEMTRSLQSWDLIQRDRIGTLQTIFFIQREIREKENKPFLNVLWFAVLASKSKELKRALNLHTPSLHGCWPQSPIFDR